MKGINFGRVILGGLVAGLIVNVSEGILHGVILKSESEAAMRTLGKTMPQGGSTVAIWVIWGFLWGIVAVWLYAAIRPRYGAGAGTAVRAGIAAWFLSHFFCALAIYNMGLFPMSGMAMVWTLAEGIIATVVGAWLYKEDAAAMA
jgi:hypothetical protein